MWLNSSWEDVENARSLYEALRGSQTLSDGRVGQTYYLVPEDVSEGILRLLRELGEV